jgi:hypothetical protein
MTLITAHKILISVSIVFFFAYALREFFIYVSQGGSASLFASILSGLAALGLLVYFRAFLRSLHR